MNDFAPAVKEILRKSGCEFVRKGRGDHEMWKSPISEKSFPVDSKIKSRHMANAILKQAGLPKAF